MKYILRLPNITGASEKEQLAQMKNYLFQLVGELQFILNSLEATSSDAAVNKTEEK